jgi:hypothetical protein
MKTKTTPEPIKAPGLLTFNGKSYRKIDLEREWTLKQDHYAAPIIAKLKPQLDKVLNFDLVKGDESEKADIDYQGQKFPITRSQFDYLKKISFEFDVIEIKVELLPLLYIEKDEPYFKEESYERRKSEFENMPRILVKEVNESVINFLNFILPSLLKDSQIYLQAIMQANNPSV